MEKKKEYIDTLLQKLQELEARVSDVKHEDRVSFSFFRDAFQKGQEMLSLLHEMEMLQIEDMKQQMGQLVSLLSEGENRKRTEAVSPSAGLEEFDAETSVSLFFPIQENVSQSVLGRGVEPLPEETTVCRNAYAEGVVLPVYANPRNMGGKQIDPNREDAAAHVDCAEEKPAVRSVNDAIQAPLSKLEVKGGLSLNDRFRCQRELFDNNREAMASTITRLNSFDNYEERESYLKEKMSWNFEDETVKIFLEFLRKSSE